MKIVVTGASGFIGSRLVSALVNRGHEVEGVARSAAAPAGTRRVSSYLETPPGEVLVHLAECSRRDAVDAELADALPTVEALVRKAYLRIVYASSVAVYGDRSPEPHRVDEHLVPTDSYTAAKLDCEARIVAARGCVARLTNVYGPGMSPDTVVPTVLGQVPGVGPLWVADDAPVRDFLWIDDAISALIAMAESSHTGVFNVASGAGVSIGEIGRLVLSLAGESHRDVVGRRPRGRASTVLLDIERTQALFDWRPMTSIDQGLNLMLREREPAGSRTAT